MTPYRPMVMVTLPSLTPPPVALEPPPPHPASRAPAAVQASTAVTFVRSFRSTLSMNVLPETAPTHRWHETARSPAARRRHHQVPSSGRDFQRPVDMVRGLW